MPSYWISSSFAASTSPLSSGWARRPATVKRARYASRLGTGLPAVLAAARRANSSVKSTSTHTVASGISLRLRDSARRDRLAEPAHRDALGDTSRPVRSAPLGRAARVVLGRGGVDRRLDVAPGDESVGAGAGDAEDGSARLAGQPAHQRRGDPWAPAPAKPATEVRGSRRRARHAAGDRCPHPPACRSRSARCRTRPAPPRGTARRRLRRRHGLHRDQGAADVDRLHPPRRAAR